MRRWSFLSLKSGADNSVSWFPLKHSVFSPVKSPTSAGISENMLFVNHRAVSLAPLKSRPTGRGSAVSLFVMASRCSPTHTRTHNTRSYVCESLLLCGETGRECVGSVLESEGSYSVRAGVGKVKHLALLGLVDASSNTVLQLLLCRLFPLWSLRLHGYQKVCMCKLTLSTPS